MDLLIRDENGNTIAVKHDLPYVEPVRFLGGEAILVLVVRPRGGNDDNTDREASG